MLLYDRTTRWEAEGEDERDGNNAPDLDAYDEAFAYELHGGF